MLLCCFFCSLRQTKSIKFIFCMIDLNISGVCVICFIIFFSVIANGFSTILISIYLLPSLYFILSIISSSLFFTFHHSIPLILLKDKICFLSLISSSSDVEFSSNEIISFFFLFIVFIIKSLPL